MNFFQVPTEPPGEAFPVLFNRYHRIVLFVQFMDQKLLNCQYEAQKHFKTYRMGHLLVGMSQLAFSLQFKTQKAQYLKAFNFQYSSYENFKISVSRADF